jgi:hypothetical protein
VDKDSDTGELLVDLAGFRDTRHPIYDLLAAFFNKKLLNEAMRVKLVIVENYGRLQLGVERSAFLSTIRHMAELLPSNVEIFKDSICLVATKVDRVDKSDSWVQKSVLSFLNASTAALDSKQKDAEDRRELKEARLYAKMGQLVNYLNDKERIGIFRRPAEEGIPWEIQPLAENLNLIRSILFTKMSYSEPKTEPFQVKYP